MLQRGNNAENRAAGARTATQRTDGHTTHSHSGDRRPPCSILALFWTKRHRTKIVVNRSLKCDFFSTRKNSTRNASLLIQRTRISRRVSLYLCNRKVLSIYFCIFVSLFLSIFEVTHVGFHLFCILFACIPPGAKMHPSNIHRLVLWLEIAINGFARFCRHTHACLPCFAKIPLHNARFSIVFTIHYLALRPVLASFARFHASRSSLTHIQASIS